MKKSSTQGYISPFCVRNDGGQRREGAAPLQMLPLPPSSPPLGTPNPSGPGVGGHGLCPGRGLSPCAGGRVNPRTDTTGSSPRTRRPFLSRGRVRLSPPTCFAGKRAFPGEITYLHWEEPFVAGLSYCSLKKWPFPPTLPFLCSLKNKAMQRNTNGTAMTRAVTRRSDLIDEISSYSINLRRFPSELCAEILAPCFDNTF